MLLTKESLAEHEKLLKSLEIRLAEAQELQDKFLHSGEDTLGAPAQELQSLVTEGKRFVEEALRTCRLLETGELPLTEEVFGGNPIRTADLKAALPCSSCDFIMLDVRRNSAHP